MHWVGLYAFVGGGTLRYEERFSAGNFVEALESGYLNILILMPTMFKLLVDAPGFRWKLLDRLDWFLFSGAAMPLDFVEALKRRRCRVGLTYGMTESCGSVTYSDEDAPAEVLANTIGRPWPPGEVRVGDDQGRVVDAGVTGEIQVRAEYCMGGYLGRPDATRDAYTHDGWLRTGDLAELRQDGNLRFVGRRSEMFKSGGYNVYPREVELALEQHEAVALAAVVSATDTLFDEVGWAYLLLKPGRCVATEELQAWCKGQLANYKIPKRFIVREALPLLPVGKVDKLALRREADAGMQRGPT